MAESKYNTQVYDEPAVDTTREFLRRTCPLVFVYAPSGTGKTTLIGSLFRHPLYHRVLLIDADQGNTTISEYARNETLCDLREFDDVPSKQSTWLSRQLCEARKVECGAIVIEGFMSVHRASVAHFAEDCDFDKPHEAMQAHAKATNVTGILVSQIRALKQYRLAGNVGVPIIVSLNTREVSTTPGDINSPKVTTPDLSRNMCEKLMATADACLEMRRPSGGTQLLTLPTPDNAFRKMRAAVPFDQAGQRHNAARLVQQQTDLSLPGLFWLWADADAQMRADIDSRLNPKHEEKTP